VALAAGWLALATGERAEAVRHVRDAASTAAADGDRVMEVRALHAAARFGRPELALPRLAALAGEVDGPWPALAHRHAAALMAGDGPALDAVAEDFAGLGAHLLAAEAGRAAAVAHRREGLPGRAAGSAGRAAGWLRLCGDPAAPTLPALDGPELTPREQEVVELAAAGWSSRSIAQRLDVSVRTVDNHLGRAYRKLGTTGRDELRASSGTGSQDPR
jgi:DNA-binding CsgD family transcriptional regulator